MLQKKEVCFLKLGDLVRKNFDSKTILLLKNVCVSFGVKGLSIVVSLVNMPIFINFFEDQAILGLWFAVLSMLNWILSFDFGIGNGLRHYLVEAFEEKDDFKINQLISSAYYATGSIAVFLIFVIKVLSPFIDWNRILNVSSNIVSNIVLVQAINILLSGILIQFVLKLINSILYAMQMAALPSFLALTSNVLLLLATFLINQGNSEQNLLVLSKTYIITINFPLLIVTLWFFLCKLKTVCLRPKYCNKDYIYKIISLGFSFLTLQFAAMILFNTRDFLIMRLISPSAVVPYQIYNKIFSLSGTFFVLAMTPMWSAITQAVSQNDLCWIKKTYKRARELLYLFTLLSILIVPFVPVIVKLWLGNIDVITDWKVSSFFVVFNLEYMWISLHSSVENGYAKLKIQKLGYFFACILYPLLAFSFSYVSKSWSSIILANCIGLLPLCIMQTLHIKKLLKGV